MVISGLLVSVLLSTCDESTCDDSPRTRAAVRGGRPQIQESGAAARCGARRAITAQSARPHHPSSTSRWSGRNRSPSMWEEFLAAASVRCVCHWLPCCVVAAQMLCHFLPCALPTTSANGHHVMLAWRRPAREKKPRRPRAAGAPMFEPSRPRRSPSCGASARCLRAPR